jgi:uncharacterized membrane protein
MLLYALHLFLADEPANTAWYALPFHPIFVNFTAALLPASFLFDLVAAISKRESLRAAAWYTLLLAAIVTPITAIAGWLWLKSMGGMGDMGEWQMPIHKWLGTAAAVLVILYACWRGWLYRRQRSPGILYALAALVLFAALLYQGDLGGSMSFRGGIVIKSTHQ